MTECTEFASFGKTEEFFTGFFVLVNRGEGSQAAADLDFADTVE